MGLVKILPYANSAKNRDLGALIGSGNLGTTAQDIIAAINEVLGATVAAVGIDDNAVSSVLAWSSAKLARTLTIVNVKDYGAVGNGATDDKAAIVSAFNYAIAHLPAEVYFPKGEYGLLSGGIYVTLPLGASGLTVSGAGQRLSRIKYLDAWEPNGTWVALRIQPDGTPSNDSQYLHDIIIKDVGVIDTDPVGHAWNTANGDPGTEETHGFDIKYAINAQYLNCGVWSVGDEALDMVACKASVVHNCYVYNCPGAGAAGGAISIGDGCDGVRVVNNVVDGSISSKTNFGIAIESLGINAAGVSNIVVANNTVRNITGNAFNIGVPGGFINNVIFEGNTIDHCTVGFASAGTGGIYNILIDGVVVTNGSKAVAFTSTNSRKLRISNIIADTISELCISSGGFTETTISDFTLTALQKQAIVVSGNNSIVENGTIDGVGLATGINVGAIQQNGALTGCVARNVKMLNNKCSKGVQGFETVQNVDIAMDEVVGYTAILGAKYVFGGVMNGIISNLQAGCIVTGVTISMTVDPGNHGITLADISGCNVSNCTVKIPGRYGIRETGTADYNRITCNDVRGSGLGLSVIGAHSVNANNLAA